MDLIYATSLLLERWALLGREDRLPPDTFQAISTRFLGLFSELDDYVRQHPRGAADENALSVIHEASRLVSRLERHSTAGELMPQAFDEALYGLRLSVRLLETWESFPPLAHRTGRPVGGLPTCRARFVDLRGGRQWAVFEGGRP